MWRMERGVMVDTQKKKKLGCFLEETDWKENHFNYYFFKTKYERNMFFG